MESLSTILIVVHLLIVLALIVTVLLQRSEGGALGMGGGGGGGGGGGLISVRGAGNLLSRSTAILAVLFFITSISLTVIARVGENSGSLLNEIELLNSTGTTTGEGPANAIESLLGTPNEDSGIETDGLALPTE